MINVLEFSKEYEVRKMGDSDAENILNLCCSNGQFYRYCEAKPTIEQVLNDLHITPPNISMSDKYYVGFYEDKALVAVMDLIDGYPNADIAYIGFFMMNPIYQGESGPRSRAAESWSGCHIQHPKCHWTHRCPSEPARNHP